MTTYIVDLRCPRCGKTHRVSNHFRLDGGPTQPGNVADLYAAGELPRPLAELLRDKVWCEVTEGWVNSAGGVRELE